jgi:ABC-type multidrug transport system fused ATPase/permease subunit
MKPKINPILKPYQSKIIQPLSILSVFSLILSLTAIGFAYVSKLAIDTYTDSNKLFLYGSLLILIMLVQVILSAYNGFYKAKATYLLEGHIRNDLYQKILRAKLKDTEDNHSAIYINHFKSDVTMITDGVYDLLPKLVFYVFRFLGAFVVLFILDWLFAVLFLTLGLLLFVLSRLLSKQIKLIQKEALSAEDELYQSMQEGLTHLEVIKAFEAESIQAESLQNASNHFFTKRMKKQWVSAFTGLGLHGFFAFGYLFAILFGTYRLSQGSIVFGSLVAIIQLVQNIQSPFSGLSNIVIKYHQWQASLDRIRMMDSLEKESSTKIPLRPFKKIEFKKVSFKYNQKSIIDNLSFELKPGELIWIKGESGKGKTTLIKLLLGLIQPNSGSIELKIDESTYALSESTRPFFSYVPQSYYLLSNTILDNLTLGKNIPMEKVIEACQTAMIYEDILKTPQGFDTKLKEMGAGLSIGQLERLSIARALLKDAPILLLDEITASLDADTEKKVLGNLKALKQKTIMMVSHRDLKDIKPTKIIELK